MLVIAQERTSPARPKVSVEQVFKQWDRNSDGKLTPDEVPREQLFKMLDRNGDGAVTKEEASAYLGGGAGQPQGWKAGQLQGAGANQKPSWRGVGVSQGAPLPPAEGFQPRPHGEEAKAAGLKLDVLARIDIEMQRHVAAKNVAGIAAIIHKNGQQGYFETFGMQDIEAGKPMPKDAIFRLMSMTKPIVALAALALYDEGQFTLDEPISKHCPEWAHPKVKDGDQIVPAKFAITPRMLMSHSSGLGYGAGGTAAAMAYGAMNKPGATLKDFSEAVAKEPLLFQPGTGYSYGMGLDILGRYLEAITGKPVDVVLKERLSGPLKMVDTDFYVRTEKVGRLCQIYSQPSPGVLRPGSDTVKVTTKPTLCLGGHGLFGTIGDYERFCRMILGRGELDGVRVLKPETVDLIFQNHLKTPNMKYGLGGIVNGAGSYGWGGADGTQFVIDRSHNFFTLFMVQTQMYKAPTYPAFLALANEAAGIASGRAGMPGRSGAGSMTPAAAGDTSGAKGITPSGSGEPSGGIDWNRAKQLYGKLKAGEKLTAEEQAYMEKVKQAIQNRGGAAKPGQGKGWPSGPDRRHQRGRQLPDESQSEKSRPAKPTGDQASRLQPGTASLAAIPRNESAATPLARLVFTQDYFPGTRDATGQFMGGTEAMWLAGHDGKLFAAIGYGQDRPGDDPKPGAQILRKDAPDARWQVDHEFPQGCMRVEGLISFAFATDRHGKLLPKPAKLLVASPSELPGRGTVISVFIRNDATGQWQRSEITSGNLGVRSFGSHVDKVTGVHHIFAGLNLGGIHRGSYDPAAPGGIRWEAKPERTAEAQPGKGRRIYDYSRVLCYAECNGDLYMAARITTDTDGQVVDGGLYRRVDEPKPQWKLVYRWPIDQQVLQSRFLRGLTAVPDPKDGNHEVLIANFEYPGTIARFDPSHKSGDGLIAADRELDIKEFFNQAWNTPNAHRRGAIAAYNRLLPVTDPASGQAVWLCGAWVERPGSPDPPNNGSCYLIRHRDGHHDWGYIYDAAHPVPAGEKLTGCRDIEPSPFPSEQNRVFYFCGYDGGAGPSHNTAWIYRGVIQRSEKKGDQR
jgi:CubicO group peptidase (beta-lactamase class C family)